MTDWTVVLGIVPSGETVILPGPQGAPGATGPRGPAGTDGGVVGVDATFFLDRPDSDIPNAEVIHRGLGPDRAPVTSTAWDDEMGESPWGYNFAQWVTFNLGTTETHDDVNGGLRWDSVDGDEAIHALEQSLPTGETIDYTAKVSSAAQFPGLANNKEFIGISLRNLTTGRWDILYHARYNQQNQVIRSKVNADSSFVSDSFSTWPDPTGFYYLRFKGDSSAMAFMVSTNGINWTTLETTALYCGVPDKIGLFVYGNEDIDWSGYVQWFRRNV